MKNVLRIILALFYGLTVVQSIASIPMECKLEPLHNPWCYIVCVFVVGVGIFIVNGFLIEGYLKRRARIRVGAVGMEVNVSYGDIFNENGVAVIGVNDFFDTLVDDCHISEKSLHGMMVKKYWGANVGALDMQIEDGLTGKKYETTVRDGMAKEKRYPIGTAVFVKTDAGKRFVLVAISRTNAETHRTQSELKDLNVVVSGALDVARERANGDTVSFPLMGSGNARIKSPEQALFNVLLASIVTECLEHEKVSTQVNIVLYKKSLKNMNLVSLEREWRI